MSLERFFASPLVARCVLNAVVFLALVMVVMVGYGASHKDDRPPVQLEPCALILDRSGQQRCR